MVVLDFRDLFPRAAGPNSVYRPSVNALYDSMFKKYASYPICGDVTCFDCGRQGRGCRIAEWLGYNRRQDKNPQFRCEECKDKKERKIKEKFT